MDQQLLETLLANQAAMQQQLATLVANGAPAGQPTHATSSSQYGASGQPTDHGAFGQPWGAPPAAGASHRQPPGPLVEDDEEDMDNHWQASSGSGSAHHKSIACTSGMRFGPYWPFSRIARDS